MPPIHGALKVKVLEISFFAQKSKKIWNLSGRKVFLGIFKSLKNYISNKKSKMYTEENVEKQIRYKPIIPRNPFNE